MVGENGGTNEDGGESTSTCTVRRTGGETDEGRFTLPPKKNYRHRRRKRGNLNRAGGATLGLTALRFERTPSASAEEALGLRK